jgi:hypothetical protein
MLFETGAIVLSEAESLDCYMQVLRCEMVEGSYFTAKMSKPVWLVRHGPLVNEKDFVLLFKMLFVLTFCLKTKTKRATNVLVARVLLCVLASLFWMDLTIDILFAVAVLRETRHLLVEDSPLCVLRVSRRK